MKKNLLFALCFCTAGFLYAQDSLNMVRLARWDDDSLPLAFSLNLQYSGCWGLALNGREYAVLGGAAHVLFFDITEPTEPKLIGKFAGTTNNTLWREFKSYKNRIYAVSDQSAEGLMIFDMQNAPDTVMRTYWSSEFFKSAHTITLDTTSGHIYLNGTNVANMVVLDVSQNPDQPTLITTTALPGGYIHDSYVRHDTLYASSGNNGYFIYDFSDPLTPVTLASLAAGGYNHNSWLNPEGTHAYFTEEIPDGRPIQIVNLQNLPNGEIELVGNFLTPSLPPSLGAPIPHNVYIKDHLLFVSQYEDGLLVYDISNPLTPTLTGRYDTHPENVQYNTYYGNWGNYPWLPSGTIISGDMQNGLQLLKLLTPPVGTATPTSDLGVQVAPNPATDDLVIRLDEATDSWSYRMIDPTGLIVQSGQVSGSATKTLSLQHCSKGLYFVEIQTQQGKKTTCRVLHH